MEQFEIIERIHELEREIALLPPGSIAAKEIKENYGTENFIEKQTFSMYIFSPAVFNPAGLCADFQEMKLGVQFIGIG